MNTQYFVSQTAPGDHGFWAVDAFPTLQTARTWGLNRRRWVADETTVNIIVFEGDVPKVIESF